MWGVRILTGPQKGQFFHLSKGFNRIGRSAACEITLQNPQVSKEHACIEVRDDKVIISDRNSRNGTFVNGIQIKSQILSLQDQITIYEIHLQLFPDLNMVRSHRATNPISSQDLHSEVGEMGENPHLNSQSTIPPFQEATNDVQADSGEKVNQWAEKANTYIEEVVLSSFYKLTETLEIQWVLGILIATFAIIVTLLSVIPATELIKSSVYKEAEKRAVSIATSIARENRGAIASQSTTNLRVDSAIGEVGIQKALIVSNPEGVIMAPAKLSGQYALDVPFIYSAIKIKAEIVESLDNNLIGVSIPIQVYNPSVGGSTIVANAIVIYDMSSIAFSSEQTMSLYIQIFSIALLFGALLLFLIYKIINHPIVEINKQLDQALKEELSNISIPYKLVSFQLMLSNMNSALNRMSSDEDQSVDTEYDRGYELAHLVQLIGFAAIGVTAHDLLITAINPEFEHRTGIDESQLLYKTIGDITDQALKLNIKDLIERSQEQQPNDMTTNELDLSGVNYEIVVQPIYGRDAISYYLIVILPSSEEHGEEGVA